MVLTAGYTMSTRDSSTLSIPLPSQRVYPAMTVQPLRITKRVQPSPRPNNGPTSKDENGPSGADPLTAPESVQSTNLVALSTNGYPRFVSIDSFDVPDYGTSGPSLSTVTKPQGKSANVSLESARPVKGLALLDSTPFFRPSQVPSTSTSSIGPSHQPTETSLHRPGISRQSSRVRFSNELNIEIYSQGLDKISTSPSALNAPSRPGRSPDKTQSSSTSSFDCGQTDTDAMGNNLRESRSTLRASSSRMTSSASLPDLPTSPSTTLTIPTSSSLSAMDNLDSPDSPDDFSPRTLRYPRLSKSMARLSQTSTRSTPARSRKIRSAKSSTSPKSMALSIPPTPRSAGFIPSTPVSAPPTSLRHSPSKSSVPGQEIRDVLQRATLALAPSPFKQSTSTSYSPASANGSFRSKGSKRDSFASIASTLFSTDGSVLTEGSSTMSTSTSSTSITSSTLSSDAGQSSLLTPKALKIWTPETRGPTDPDGAEETPLAGLYGFPLSPSSSPIRSKTFPSVPSVIPPASPYVHQRADSNLSAILDWTPCRHVRADSNLSFVHDFPIPPSRPTLQVVIADIDSPDSNRVLSFERPPSPASTPLMVVEEESEDTPRPKPSAMMQSPAFVEEPTMLPYLAPSAPMDGAEFDLDLSAPLMDVALRSNIISPNSRLNRLSLSSRRSSDDGPSTTLPQIPMFRTTSTPGSSRVSHSARSSRSSVRSSTTTLRPLSLSSRHSGEGWSGSESEEEEFISALQGISIRRLSTTRLKRIPSLMRPRAVRSVTSPACPSPRTQSRTLEDAHPRPRSPLAVASPRTPSSGSATYRLSGQSQSSRLSTSTCSEMESALLTPCPSSEGPISNALPLTRRAGQATTPSDAGPKDGGKTRLPRPTRRVEGWGMPEILIDEDWSSGDDARPWSSDDEFEMEKGLGKVTGGEGEWLLSEEM